MTPQSISFSKDPLVPKDKFRYVGPKSSVKTKQKTNKKKHAAWTLIFSLLSFLLFPNWVVKFLSAQDPSVEDSLKIA